MKIAKILTSFFILAILACAVSCRTNESSTVDGSALANIVIRKPDNSSTINLSDIVKEVKIIPLEFNKFCIIGRIRKIKIFDKKVYLLDEQNQSHLYVFNLQGQFLNTIGHLGKGPREHQIITDFDVDRNNNIVIIWDNVARKLLEFDLQGNFVKTIHIKAPADNFAVSNNLFYMYRPNPQMYTKYSLNLYDKEGNHVKGFLRSKNYPIGTYSPDIFSGYGKKLFFHAWLNDTIYSLGKEKMYAKYFIDFGKHAVSEPDKEILLRSPEKSMKILNNNKYASGISNIQKAKDILCFAYVYGNVRYTGFYNINDGQFKNTNSIIDDLSYLYFRQPIAENDGRFIGVYDLESIEPNISQIKERIESGKKLINKERALKTLSILEKVNQNISRSNPLLIYYEVK